MTSERIGGIGSISCGEYDSIQIDGIGKLKGSIKANQISVNGMSRSKGKIEVSLLNINGIHKAKRTIKAREAAINGVLRLKKASLHADKINCTGSLYCGHELSADQISIQGIFSISHIYGDTVKLFHDENVHLPIGRKSRLGCRLLFGFRIPGGASRADYVECTELVASNTKFKTIHAGSVTLSQNCEVDKIYCDGPVTADSTCTIGKIISSQSKGETP